MPTPTPKPWRVSTVPDLSIMLIVYVVVAGMVGSAIYDRTWRWGTVLSWAATILGPCAAIGLVVALLRLACPPLEGGDDWIAYGRGSLRVSIRADEVVRVERERAGGHKDFHTERYTLETSDRRTIHVSASATGRDIMPGRIQKVVKLAIEGAAAKAAAHASDGHAFRNPRGYVLQPDRVQLPDGASVPYAEIRELLIEKTGSDRWARTARVTSAAGRTLAALPDDPVFLKALARLAKVRPSGVID